MTDRETVPVTEGIFKTPPTREAWAQAGYDPAAYDTRFGTSLAAPNPQIPPSAPDGPNQAGPGVARVRLTQIVHGSICCSKHGCAVSCIGDANDDALVGSCPHGGEQVVMASPKYFRDHAAGVAEPFDAERLVARHQNKGIRHMFEDDDCTVLKPEFRDAEPAAEPEAVMTGGDDPGPGLEGEPTSFPTDPPEPITAGD